jgi:hypothetical protein
MGGMLTLENNLKRKAMTMKGIYYRQYTDENLETWASVHAGDEADQSGNRATRDESYLSRDIFSFIQGKSCF